MTLYSFGLPLTAAFLFTVTCVGLSLRYRYRNNIEALWITQ